MSFEAPYDFATLKKVILSINPQQTKPVNRGETIAAWVKEGATDKATRNKALTHYTETGRLISDGMKAQLAETPILVYKYGDPVPKEGKVTDYFDWEAAQKLFVLKTIGSEKGWLKHPADFYFRFLKKGDPTKKACNLKTTARVHYEGKLIDGTVFDSSFARNQPAVFAPEAVISSWKLLLQLLPEGSEVELLAPPQHAYGPMGSPPAIPPMSTLYFRIQIIECLGADAKEGAEAVSQLEMLTRKKWDDM
jgi:hypothetical protein